MSASDYLENKLLNLVYAGVAFTPPARFLALLTTPSTDAGIGLEVPTASTAYARQAVGFTVSGGTASLGATVNFPVAATAWGTISHWAILDTSTGATNLLNHGAFDTARPVAVGDVFTLSAGGLTISMD